MSALFISLLTLILLLISAFVVLLVLMQRTSQSGGMGAALGGGAAESAFGSDTSNVLTKGTIYGIICFFVVALVLYLMYQASAEEQLEATDATLLVAPETEVTATTAPAEDGVTVEVTTAEDLLGTIEATVESNEVKVDEPTPSTEAAAPAAN
jgi:preprotein translocase subunit SecG